MEEREQQGRGMGCILCCAVLAIVPVLYVLSIGPAALIASHYPSTEDWLGPIYIPIGMVADNCTPINDALEWYMELWHGGQNHAVPAPPNMPVTAS